MIDRILYESIKANLHKQKVGLLLGARRVGKTNLLKRIKENFAGKTLWLNGEDENVAAILNERTIANYKRLLGGVQLLIIDEAQYINDIGRKVKLMIDEMEPLHIIITGSSAFDLEQASEPLVGRTITYNLYSIAQMELSPTENLLETKQNLAERLIYGSYPEAIMLETLAEKKSYLTELVNTYLLKDILAFENVRNPQKIKDLLVLLAYQTGNEVSLEELGRKLGISKNTVERYLDLLSKVFIIYKRKGYSKNLRKEISKSSKWYFCDNGVRNALINNFNLIPARQDIGALWENYISIERIKYNVYTKNEVNSYFWRTYDQQEIDLVEEKADLLNAYEFKWAEGKVKVPAGFSGAYPQAGFEVISQKNYIEFIVPAS